MDTELVIHARNGDQGTFATLADSVYGRLHQVAYRILRDRPGAEAAARRRPASPQPSETGSGAST